MSNFFTNLTTRSFAPASDVLQPKLPSLFEAPTANEPVLEAVSGIDAHEEGSETAPVSPANRSRSEKYTRSETERGTPPPAESMLKRPERQHVARQTILPFTPEEPPQALTGTQSKELIAPATVRAETKLVEREQATGPRLEAVTPSVRKNENAEPVSGSGSRLIPVISKPEQTHPIPQNNNDVDAKIFPLKDRSPTVHIHIGRIEVRAVTQASPPARPIAPNRPKMTLDDYLLRRNEGKR